MYKALYREYRPEIFDEILGQEHIVRILKNQLATDSVSHAYLFCGTRGTGKTTTARILAKGLNCLNEAAGGRPCGRCANCLSVKEGTFIDVIEIDAASNNGVENIRELRESVKYPPAAGRKKIYIIDEVHMLSTGAFNALLKTLEEPPEHVVFILATTEPQKLPATILSRCMRLDFKRVSEGELRRGMADICAKRGLEASDEALRLVAANADGSVRDGLSILEQCVSSGLKSIGRDDVLELLGTLGQEVFLELTDHVKAGNAAEGLLLVNRALADGKDVRQFMKDWLSHYRALLVSKFIKSPEDILNMSTENVDRVRTQADRMDLADINNAIIELSHTMSDAKWSNQPRILLELCIVKLATGMMGAVQPVVRAAAVEPAVRKAAVKRQEAVKAEAEKEERSPQAQEQELPAPQAPQFDLDELWYRVFEEGENGKTSFNLIRTGTRLAELTETEFVVVAASELKKKYVLDNQQELEALMERFTGSRRRLDCVRADRLQERKTGAQQIETELADLFGGAADR